MLDLFDITIEVPLVYDSTRKYYRKKLSRQDKFKNRARLKNSWLRVDISTLSRKEKLAILGRKLNKSQIKKRLSTVTVRYTIDHRQAHINTIFCPNCGCYATNTTGNMAQYPEVYENTTCMRCGRYLGGADNSLYYTYLEGECDEDILYWKSMGVKYIHHSDTQDDIEFKNVFK